MKKLKDIIFTQLKMKLIISIIVFFILVVLLNNLLNFTFSSIVLEVLSPEQDDTYQLFYNTGRGFNEIDSIKYEIKKSRNTAEVIFEGFPFRKIRDIRIDPGTGEGDIIIKSIKFSNLFGKYSEEIDFRNFKPMHHINNFSLDQGFLRIHSTGNDPYFIYTGNLPEASLFSCILSLLLTIAFFFSLNLIPGYFKDFKFDISSFKLIIKSAIIWLFLLATGLLLLSGRYNWEEDVKQYSLRGYLSSAYMFVIVLPTLYYLLKFFIPRTKIAKSLTLFLAILFTLPYRWLGLDKWYYHRNRFVYKFFHLDPTREATFDWLPQGLTNLDSIPYELLFFTVLLILGMTISGFYIFSLKKSYFKEEKIELIQKAIFWCCLYILILLQTWLHLSMRSPYSYIATWPVYLFSDGQGVVNGDYFVFRDLEEHFIGVPKETNTMLIRRSFPFYISSQLSYFISPYYVFLILNIILWFTASICAYHFFSYCCSKDIASYIAFLVACGSGFIMYAGQPMSYLPGYAIIIIIIFLFEVMIVKDQNKSLGNYLLFGSLLGLSSMIYDIFALYLYFFFYNYMSKLSGKKLIFSLIISIFIYSGFSFLQKNILQLAINQENTQVIKLAFNNLYSLVINFDLVKFYVLTVTFLRTYFGSLAMAFLIIPFVYAIMGSFFVGKRFSLFILLVLPSFFNTAFLYYGESLWLGLSMASLPRLIYISYPAIYLLSAIFLYEIKDYFNKIGITRLAIVLPWLLLAVVFIMNNIDVFGYPQLYYHFYFPARGLDYTTLRVFQ